MNADYLNATVQFFANQQQSVYAKQALKNSQLWEGYLSASKGAFEIQPPPSKISAFSHHRAPPPDQRRCQIVAHQE